MPELIKSWTNESALQELSRKHHFNEILEGVVRSVTTRTLKERGEDNELREIYKDVLVIALPGGITGYCPAEDFSDVKHRNYARFVGQKEKFMISQIDLNSEFLLKSVDRMLILNLMNGLGIDAMALIHSVVRLYKYKLCVLIRNKESLHAHAA